MVSRKRTLLIVEDDSMYNTLFTLNCEEALNEIPSIQGVIKKAFDYAEAKQILESTPVDFVSVDIALSPEETNRTEQKDRDAQEAGGILVLEELQKNKNLSLSIIVSGEKLLSYGIDAYSKYNVLAFYQKDKLDPEKYKNAVKTALFYLEAADAISTIDTDVNALNRAEGNWHKALESAKVAGITVGKFPEDLGKRIELTRREHFDVMTDLPQAHWTNDHIKEKISWKNQWTIIYVIIKGFNQFITANGSQETPILQFIGTILKRTRDKFQDQQLFIGHLRRQDYGADPAFLVLSSQDSFSHSAEKIAAWIKDEFAKVGSDPFTRQLEAKNNQPKLEFTLETKVLTGTISKDPQELLDEIGAIPNESL